LKALERTCIQSRLKLLVDVFRECSNVPRGINDSSPVAEIVFAPQYAQASIV
jgi:hypothetical protein